MKKKNNVVFTILLGVLFAPAAMATIIGGAITGGGALTKGGSFIDLGSAPSGLSVGKNTFQNPNLYGFNEDQNIILTSDLSVDVGPSLTISSGTEVASHYIAFDPRFLTTVSGWVEFDSEILGIITSTTNLNNSDFLINNSVTYLSPNLRGLEVNQDSVLIDPSNKNRLNLSLKASNPGDYFRVLTKRSKIAATVPEPASIALMGLGLLGFGFLRKNNAR